MDDFWTPQNMLSAGQVVMALVTAGATIALWHVTRVLADETKKMAERSSQPHVVATIEPNRWATNHADITVANTGNAVAYDIRVAFDPPLESRKGEEHDVPLNRISLLRPGLQMTSWLNDMAAVLGKTYTVTISWLRSPADEEREEIRYTIDMSDYSGVSWLGERDPRVKIANEAEKTRKAIEKLSR